MNRHRHHDHGEQAGFTLIETMLCMFLLTVGVLGLAQVFTVGMRQLATSAPSLIAREKAREAIESVHTARDMRVITWSQINNLASAGVFKAGAQPLLQAGPDGLVNTADDGTGCSPSTLASPCYDAVVAPGPDAILGTGDDLRTELRDFTREIQITELVPASATLRRLRVIVRFRTTSVPMPTTCVATDDTPLTLPGCYVLTTYVSSFS
jgi:prepilin-type N-terminal cleavage/methylation domain-containing protein